MNRTILALALSGLSAWAVSAEGARITKSAGAPLGSLGFAARSSGSIELQLDIDEKGQFRSARIVSGRPDFAQAAVQTVRGWQFKPAKLDGRNVKSKLNVILAFDFDSRK